MLSRKVADGVYRVARANVNLYFVNDGGRITLIDAGLPTMWEYTMGALREIGLDPKKIEAIVLTHAHFDHIGFAARAQRELGLPVYGHEGDSYIAAHPYRYQRQKTPFLYPFRYPRCIPILAGMARNGALNVHGVEGLKPLTEGVLQEVPGQPEVVHTPGHTAGSCALFLRERGVLISGDALVTLDPYTGKTGPRIVAAAATADPPQALESLELLAATGAETVLPGHGEPWTKGIATAVRAAREAGAR
jgi:glyoxylase-like metal-dependent hydrolase (beta-lactamase superfamily II)